MKFTANFLYRIGSTSIDGRWESSLAQNELKILQELGLGVAIDITAKHPWATKSSFVAKKTTKEDDLVVVNECNKFHSSREHVEKYSEIQAGLESSFRPDPSKPINVTVAADVHRSNTRSKTIEHETILTRTVAFRARDPANREKCKEEFELNLHNYLEDNGCFRNSKYDETTNHVCLHYLKELGGVTHYVSSITLGATKYHVHLNSTLFNSLSTSSGIAADSFVAASVKSKASRKVFQSQSKRHEIGKIPDKRSILHFRTKGEAVVKCSYNSLANLVSNRQLREQLEMGIHEYIDAKTNGTRELLCLDQCSPQHTLNAKI